MAHEENIEKLIGVLEKAPKFNMKYFFVPRECGTPSCILGHWYLEEHEEIFDPNSPRELSESKDKFCKALKISPKQGQKIFLPDTKYAYVHSKPGKKKYINRDKAIRMLRYLQHSGKVKWGPKIDEFDKQRRQVKELIENASKTYEKGINEHVSA